jgi:Protein of unknown function (DUF2971)
MPLFKYMSTEVAPQFFAGDLKIRFTQPFELNDPFEFRPMLDFVGTVDDAHNLVEARINQVYGTVEDAFAMMEKQLASDPKLANALIAPLPVLRKVIVNNPDLRREFMAEMQRHKAEVLANTKMAPWFEAEWEKFRQALGQALGILSLTEDAANTTMWSHYASQHYGVVIEFDEEHPWFNQKVTPTDDLRHLERVSYVQNPRPRTWKQVSGIDMLYTKTYEWSYEREWRIIRPLKEGTEVSPGIFCFDVPPEAIRGVIFGCRTMPGLENQIRNSLAANPALAHVRLKRAKLGGSNLGIADVA